MVWRISWATVTSRVRSPPGSGVSEMRMVSPIPRCSSTASAAGGGHDPLGPHPRLGEPEMERVVAAGAEFAIDGDQVLHLRDLGRDHDAVARHAEPLRQRGAAQPRFDQRLAHDAACVPGLGPGRVLVHEPGQQVLVEAAPVDADAHRAVVFQRDLDHGLELPVALLAEADIARIDAVLGQRLGTGGMVGEQAVAVIVEVADQRHVAAGRIQPLADRRHRRGRGGRVDGDAHDLGAGVGQRPHLVRRGAGVRRIGIGHRLDPRQARRRRS